MWKRKKRSSGLVKFIFFILALLLVGFSFFLIGKKVFVIGRIEIEPTRVGCADENLLKSSTGLLGRSMLFIDRVKIENHFKNSFYCIKSVTISQKFPNKVKLSLLERQAFARLINLEKTESSMSSVLEKIATPSAQNIKDVYVIDDEGMVFSKDKGDTNTPNIYIFDSNITINKKLEGTRLNLLKIIDKVQTFGIKASESWIFDNSYVLKAESEDLKIIFNLTDKIDIQLASLQLILDKAKIDSEKLEFIDLRYDKPIIRAIPKKKL